MDSTSGWTLAILALLISLSAFFSASETAFSSVNKLRLRSMADDGDKRAKRALKIAERYDKTISVILIGNNVVNIAATSAFTALATAVLGQSGIAVATAIMTVVILTFGEVLPKGLAKVNAEKTAFAFSAPLSVIITILTPIAWLFVKLQELVARFFAAEAQPFVTERELLNIIETSEEEGVIDEQRSELMQSVMGFDDTSVQEVLTPRVDLAAISIDDDKETIMEIMFSERFSRIPVYEKTLDNIIGILHTRDYLEAAITSPNTPDLKSLLAKPLFVHKTQNISDMLNQFKKARTHIAVVLDDYGGTMGIVTMEDLLEELVGEIYDEDEEVEQDFHKIDKYTYSISGDYNVYEALEMIDYENKNFDSEYSTMGGWAFEQLDRVPTVGDTFDYDGIDVEICEMDDQRVTRLVVKYISEAGENFGKGK